MIQEKFQRPRNPKAQGKFQIPNSKQVPVSKFQVPKRDLDSGIWNLFGIWYLVFGIFLGLLGFWVFGICLDVTLDILIDSK